MLWFIIPLTVVTLAVVTARASRILESRKQP
jgi:hypothetical protein